MLKTTSNSRPKTQLVLIRSLTSLKKFNLSPLHLKGKRVFPLQRTTYLLWLQTSQQIYLWQSNLFLKFHLALSLNQFREESNPFTLIVLKLPHQGSLHKCIESCFYSSRYSKKYRTSNFQSQRQKRSNTSQTISQTLRKERSSTINKFTSSGKMQRR